MARTFIRETQISGSYLVDDRINYTTRSINASNSQDLQSDLNIIRSVIFENFGLSGSYYESYGYRSLNTLASEYLNTMSSSANFYGDVVINQSLTVNSGNADFNSGITSNQIKIDGDIPNRIYIVDSDGSIKDEEKIIFNNSDLLIDGNIGLTGSLTAQSGSFSGVVSTNELNVSSEAGISDILISNGSILADNDLLIESNTGHITFIDNYFSSSFSIKLADNSNMSLDTPLFSGVSSIVGAFNKISDKIDTISGSVETIGGSAHIHEKEVLPILSPTNTVQTAFSLDNDDKFNVYLNGVLLNASGTVLNQDAVIASGIDAAFSGSSIIFAFDLKTGDLVTFEKINVNNSSNGSSSNSSVVTASFALNADLLDGLDSADFGKLNDNNIFSGINVFNNSLTANGNNKFGNSSSDNHQFTGSVGFSNGLTGSLLGTASFASNSNLLDNLDSTAFAILSSNNIFTGNNTFNGNNIFGNSSADNHQFTGSVGFSNGLTGSLLGTASFASNSNLLDSLDSTAFAQLSLNNVFTGNNIFGNSSTDITTISGSLFISGSVKATAPGQILNMLVLSAADVGFTINLDVTGSSFTGTGNLIGTYDYSPISNQSYINIDCFARTAILTTTDSPDTFASRITVAGTQIAIQEQYFYNVAGGGSRSTNLFPLFGRYTNTTTSNKTINIQARRSVGNDTMTIIEGSNDSFWLRITEIAR